jgi:hypothetical protein
MNPVYQDMNQSSMTANNMSTYFTDPSVLVHYVGDENIDFDKTAILYEGM